LQAENLYSEMFHFVQQDEKKRRHAQQLAMLTIGSNTQAM